MQLNTTRFWEIAIGGFTTALPINYVEISNYSDSLIFISSTKLKQKYIISVEFCNIIYQQRWKQ